MANKLDRGSKIGNYTIDEFLGNGSYGDTYRVKDAKGKLLALKILKDSAESGGEKRFEAEEWVLKQLKSDKLPKFVDSGKYQKMPYLVMTYAKGKPLGALYRQQLEDNGAMGEMKMLDILADVLDALSYLHSIDICHRDIKPDNIMVQESSAKSMVIDLGFCKCPDNLYEGETFFNAGASRYSSPSKLEHPSRKNPKDDVFSVGVIAYQLLTNKYPWSVGISGDVGDLRKQMETKVPAKIDSANSMVSQTTSEWVMSMLSIDESKRPTANAALNSLREIRHRDTGHVLTPVSSQLLANRVIRDPIHGDIRLTNFEWEVMATPEFQRLRYIKQLGFSNLIYPSAEHTRFAHSLGAMHVTERILQSVELSSGQHIALEDRLIARAYALIHDVTHVPFGHTIEDELGLFDRHDENNERITRLFFSDDSEIGNVLRSTEYGRFVLELLEKDENTVQRKLHLQEFIDSPFGSDVIDYIDRDSYFCGLDHKVDSAIFRRYSLLSQSDHESGEEHLGIRLYGSHGIRLDASYAIERILLERYSLFMKVYAHTMKFSAGAMLGKALFYAIGDGQTKIKQADLEKMGDDELLIRLAQSRHGTTSALGKRLLRRSLYKPVYIGRVLNDNDLNLERARELGISFGSEAGMGFAFPAKRDQFEKKIAKKCGVPETDVIVFFPPQAPGIKKVKTWVEGKPGQVSRPTVDTEGRYNDLLKRHLALWKLYVFVAPETPEDKRKIIALEAQVSIGPVNELDPDGGLDLS